MNNENRKRIQKMIKILMKAKRIIRIKLIKK
jgi:hypothetical protein